jgi:hypothetical protein
MSDLFVHQDPYHHKPRGLDGRAVRMEVADYGPDDGIDVSVYDPFTGLVCFELVVLKPDDCLLLGNSAQSMAAFTSLRRALGRAAGNMCISVSIELCCRQVGSPLCTDQQETRTARVLRMIENLADEIQTYQPGAFIEVAVRSSEGELLSMN